MHHLTVRKHFVGSDVNTGTVYPVMELQTLSQLFDLVNIPRSREAPFHFLQCDYVCTFDSAGNSIEVVNAIQTPAELNVVRHEFHIESYL